MKTKIPVVIGFIALLAAMIILIVHLWGGGAESPGLQFNGHPSIPSVVEESSDVMLEEPEEPEIDNSSDDPLGGVIGPVRLELEPVLPEDSDPAFADEETWERGELGAVNSKVVTYQDPVLGEISVGAKNADIGTANLNGGIVLQTTISNATADHPYGVRFLTQYGTLCCCNADGDAVMLYGSALYTHYGQGSSALPGESVVLLGRTWDLQKSLAYNGPSDFGLIWLHPDNDPQPKSSVVLQLQVFDLVDKSMAGQYDVEIGMSGDNYALSAIRPHDNRTLTAAEIEKLKDTAIEVASSGIIASIGDDTVLSREDVYLDDVDYVYWGEAPAPNKFPVDTSTLTVTGNLVAATVNTHNLVLGPLVIYLTVATIPSDDATVADEIHVNYVAYDYFSPFSWDRFVQLNMLDVESYTVKNYKPLS